MGDTKDKPDSERAHGLSEKGKRPEGEADRTKQEAERIVTETEGADGKKVTLKDIRGGGA